MWITHRHVAALGKRLVDTTRMLCGKVFSVIALQKISFGEEDFTGGGEVSREWFSFRGRNMFGTCFGETGLKKPPEVFRHDTGSRGRC